jgi:hypothetical protein
MPCDIVLGLLFNRTRTRDCGMFRRLTVIVNSVVAQVREVCEGSEKKHKRVVGRLTDSSGSRKIRSLRQSYREMI